MTEPGRQLRESSFVLHSFGRGTEGNQEEFDLVQPRMSEHVGTLGKHRVQSPEKDQRELVTDLPLGTRSTHLAAFGRLHETQCEGRPITDREVLPHHVDEVAAREPLELCHQVIVSTCAHSSRKDT